MLPSDDPPAPDTASRPSYISERIVDVLFSRTNQYRAIVTQDSQGFFRVHRDHWYLGDWDIGKASWTQDDHHATITDSAANARQLALEALRATPDGLATLDI